MALKAYKHLTDGEVKIVASGSAEETALLADVVHGGSYLQLTSAGHAQEVAAAQGTALWEDVSADLGGGSSFEHLTEDLDNGYLRVSYSGGIFVASETEYYSERYTEIGKGQLYLGTAASGVVALNISAFNDASYRFIVTGAGVMRFGDGSSVTDTTFQRAAAGVMEIVQAGGGLRLHSPDGLSTKTLQLNNDGVTLSLV